MKNKVKHMAKDAMIIGVTGVGLSVASGLGGGAAVGKMAGGVGAVGGIVMASHAMGILGDTSKKINKHMRY